MRQFVVFAGVFVEGALGVSWSSSWGQPDSYYPSRQLLYQSTETARYRNLPRGFPLPCDFFGMSE